MLSFFAGLFLGVLLGWLTLGCLVNEEVRSLVRWVLLVVARILAGTACALGVGLVVGRIALLVLGGEFRSIDLIPGIDIKSPGEAFGVAAALLFGGILGMVLTFRGRRPSSTAREGSKGAVEEAVPSEAAKGSDRAAV
jgi:hypothetical protein